MADHETDQELQARYAHVQSELAKARKRMERAKLGTGKRDDRARWAGCLNFTLLGIESELRDRGLLADPYEEAQKKKRQGTC